MPMNSRERTLLFALLGVIVAHLHTILREIQAANGRQPHISTPPLEHVVMDMESLSDVQTAVSEWHEVAGTDDDEDDHLAA